VGTIFLEGCKAIYTSSFKLYTSFIKEMTEDVIKMLGKVHRGITCRHLEICKEGN
jgi:hypothetical protein